MEDQEMVCFLLEKKKTYLEKETLTREENKQVDLIDCLIEIQFKKLAMDVSTVTIPSKETLQALFQKKTALEKKAHALKRDFLLVKAEYSSVLNKINDLKIPLAFF